MADERKARRCSVVTSLCWSPSTEEYPVSAVELVQLQWKLLPVRFHAEEDYKLYLPEALAELKNRDPEDVHILALAKSQGLSLWSNDRDLAKVTVECSTTAKLLRILEDQSKS